MTVNYIVRPTALSGCWAAWSERDQEVIIRSQMDSGQVKVRKRTTGHHRIARVSARFPADQYDDFMLWFRDTCQGGALPTTMVEPTGVDAIWRFRAAPEITWVGREASAFEVSAEIERLPGWGVV